MTRNTTLALMMLTLGCSGADPSGTYTGTLDGHYADMDAPAADGTGANRSFDVHQPVSVVVATTGDRAYRFEIAGCSATASNVATLEAPLAASGGSCTLALAEHGTVTIDDVTVTVSIHERHVEGTLDGSGAAHADGMRPALHVTFTADRP